MIEQEIKFELATRGDYEKLLGALREACGDAARPVSQVSRYLDTEDYRLARALAMLRIRSAPEHVLTYKSGRQIEAGTFRSREFESTLANALARSVLASPSSLYDLDRESVRELERDHGRLPLKNIGALENLRWKLPLDGYMLELDRMSFRGGAEEYELEIESDHIDAARAWCLQKFRSLDIEARPSTETKLHRLLRRMGDTRDWGCESQFEEK